MSYESWRISFQSSEQAARSAYEQASSLGDDLDDALKAKAQYQIMLADMTERLHSAEKQRDELLAAFESVSTSLRKAGASIPAPENKGTIESAMATGLSIALLLVEDAIASVKDGAV